MSKYWKYIGLLIIVVLITGGACLGYKDISFKNKLESQQKAISELQNYQDEQVRLSREVTQREEEDDRIAEQSEVEQREQNNKQDCEDTKRYCSEEIVSRKKSIEDIRKQVKKHQAEADKQNEKCKEAKADKDIPDKEVSLVCLQTISPSGLDEEVQNLAEQEKGLNDLLKGKCLNYQASC